LREVALLVTSRFFVFRRDNVVKINGEVVDATGKTISEYLATANFNPTLIVVELNEEIVPKSQYDKTIIEDDDTIEIVSFVGGG
jgi:sulfur carrier protein